MASAAEAALAELAACSPAELSRVVRLHQVHVQCAAAGVLASAAGLPGSAAEGKGSVAELHDLFDASVQHGMHQLVCHYVDEVCGHEGFSSPDGVEAYLQDGEMVAEWATAALRAAETVLDQAAMQRGGAAAADVDRSSAVFEAVRDVLCALGADPAAAEEGAAAAGYGATGSFFYGTGNGGGAAGAAGFHARLQTAHDVAARRIQHAAALSWVLREGLGSAAAGVGSQDRFGGPAAWAGTVQVRRAAAAAAAAAAGLPPDVDAGALFLDDLLDGVGVHPPPYPFKSPAEAAERIFRDGSAAPGALVAKQSLFLYYLLDAGMPPDGAPARFARAARMHPRLFAEVRAAALLDDWGGGEALDEACVLLPRAAHPALPLRFVAVLAARGRPADALAVARARRNVLHAMGSGGGARGAGGNEDVTVRENTAAADEAAAEAELGVAVRLECGLGTEAFLVACHAVAAAPHVRRDAVASALVSRLASHAAVVGVLGSVLELPFEGEMERALVAWLGRHSGVHPGVASYLPVVYHLMRGRAVEAAEVMARTGGLAALPHDVAEALKTAVRALPEPMQRMCLGGAAAAAEVAAGGTRALTRGVVVAPAVPADFATTPAGAVLAGEKAPSVAVLKAMSGPIASAGRGSAGSNGGARGEDAGGHVPFFAPPLTAAAAAAGTVPDVTAGNWAGAGRKSEDGLGRRTERMGADTLGGWSSLEPSGGAAAGASPSQQPQITGRGDVWTELRLSGDEERAAADGAAQWRGEGDRDGEFEMITREDAANDDDDDMMDASEEYEFAGAAAGVVVGTASGKSDYERRRTLPGEGGSGGSRAPAVSRVPEPAVMFSPFGGKSWRRAFASASPSGATPQHQWAQQPQQQRGMAAPGGAPGGNGQQHQQQTWGQTRVSTGEPLGHQGGGTGGDGRVVVASDPLTRGSLIAGTTPLANRTRARAGAGAGPSTSGSLLFSAPAARRGRDDGEEADDGQTRATRGGNMGEKRDTRDASIA